MNEQIPRASMFNGNGEAAGELNGFYYDAANQWVAWAEKAGKQYVQRGTGQQSVAQQRTRAAAALAEVRK